MLEAQVRYVVGIDAAKHSHVACALDARSGAIHQRPLTIAATAEGYAALCTLLRSWAAPEAIVVGVEATGCLWEPLYEALIAAGFTVLVLNPRQTAAWATGLGLRAKTDGIDAQTLARGVLAGYARASELPSDVVQELRTLTRARRDLVEAQTAAKQRLRDELAVLFPELPGHTPAGAALFSPAVLAVLDVYSSARALAQAPFEDVIALLRGVSEGAWAEEEARALQECARQSAASGRAVAARGLVVRTMARHLRDLQGHIAELERAITAATEHDAGSRHLQTIPGVGPLVAATARAELGEVSRFAGVDQVVAYAGLDPRTQQSGAFIGRQRLSKRGPGALRHILYLAVINAVRNRAEWRERYERLLGRGRAKKEALAILSRSMLKIVYHLLRTGADYDPAALSPAPRGAGLDTAI